MKTIGIFILVGLFGCVVGASILDKVDSLRVLRGDDSSRVAVQTGVLKSRGEKVVLKIFRGSKSCKEKKGIKRGQNEYQALRKIDSPYVIKAIEGEKKKGEYMFIEEYFDGCAIDRLPRKSYNVSDVYEMLDQFGKGIDAIHRSRVLHNDLYPQNLMIGSNVHGIIVKIIDFDDCESLGKGYAESTDWERFGKSLYKLFTGERIRSKDTSPSVSYPELSNLDPRLASFVNALCISKTIKTYDDYLKELRSHNWETGGSLEMGTK